MHSEGGGKGSSHKLVLMIRRLSKIFFRLFIVFGTNPRYARRWVNVQFDFGLDEIDKSQK